MPSSPYDQWLSKRFGEEIEDAEVVVDELQPPVKKLTINNVDWNERRRELHKWKKRAKAVGITPLPPKRPTKGQRLEWEMSIIRAEEEQADTNAES